MSIFHDIIAQFGTLALIGALAVMFLGGFTKGVVGFALPMISVSGIGSIMSADMAILALLLPGLVTNVWQAFRAGVISARGFVRDYWLIFAIMPVVLAISAQVFTMMSEELLFLVLGVIVVSFALLELSGFRGAIAGQSSRWEVIAAVLSGISGGLSGVWGPPIMVYLLARNILKSEFVQVMGLVFLVGAIVLNLSHLNSGLLSAHSAPFSTLMIVPALAGMWLGYRVQDRLDQQKFRRATLFVLLLAGLNLLRRGLF